MHRRIWAPHENSKGQADLLARLRERETRGGACSTLPSAADALRHATLQQSWDLFSPEHSSSSGASTDGGVDLSPLLARRSAVTEVLFTPEGLVLALTASGLCAVFRRGGGRLCLLNVEPDERIESLFVSRSSGSTSIISVSLFVHDARRQLRCRATPAAALATGNPHCWRPLFASETLRFPGFVEFCDINDKCLTLCAESRAFKVWDLSAPGRPPLFEVPAEAGVKEIKLTTDVALAVLAPPRPDALLLALLALADGSVLVRLELPLDPGSPLELLEPLGRHVLAKQAGGPCRIHDLATGKAREIAAAEFGINHTLIDAPLNGSFLTFSDGCGVQLWSLAGRRIARLAGPGQLAGDASAGAGAGAGADAWATLFLSRGQDLLLAYCRGQGCAGRDAQPGGAAPLQQPQEQEQSPRVVAWDVLRGRRAAVVAPPAVPRPSSGTRPGEKARAAAAERAAAALAHVRTIFYDEARHELLLGTAHGHVHVWG